MQNEKIRTYFKDHQLWPTQDDGIFIVYVRFIIEKNGTTSNITIKRGVDPYFDKEAIRLIKVMPKWQPGIKNKQKVRTEMDLPIKWSFLNDD